jgi:hypothetical protein
MGLNVGALMWMRTTVCQIYIVLGCFIFVVWCVTISWRGIFLCGEGIDMMWKI